MKAPEEMAEEYTRYWWPDYNDVKTCCQTHLATRQAFLAGYQAAKDQVADVSKVMCNTTMEEIKAVDTGEITPITNLPTSAKWISVKEQMPAANICVLIAQDKTIWVSGYCDTLKTWGWYENGETCRPTHWMPLPEPPKEGK